MKELEENDKFDRTNQIFDPTIVARVALACDVSGSG